MGWLASRKWKCRRDPEKLHGPLCAARAFDNRQWARLQQVTAAACLGNPVRVTSYHQPASPTVLPHSQLVVAAGFCHRASSHKRTEDGHDKPQRPRNERKSQCLTALIWRRLDQEIPRCRDAIFHYQIRCAPAARHYEVGNVAKFWDPCRSRTAATHPICYSQLPPRPGRSANPGKAELNAAEARQANR